VKAALEFDNIETIKRAIEIGAGISLLPEPTITREIESGTLVHIPLEGQPLVRPLGIIHRRDRKLSETAQQLIALLRNQAAPVGSDSMTVMAESNGHTQRRRKKASVAS
jgi:DNA-binding transcriptional LysR family regulator